MQQKKNYIPILTALISVVGWGLVGIFIRLSSLRSPLLIISLRFVITFLILCAVLLLRGKIRQTFVALVKDKVAILLSVLLFLTYLLGTIAFMLSSIGEVTLLISVSPFFIILFKKFRREAISVREYAGTLLAVMGVVIILFPQLRYSQSASSLFGDLLAITAALLFAALIAISNRAEQMKKEIDSMGITLGTCLLGVLIFLYVVFFDMDSLTSVNLVGYNVVSILALGIFSTAIPTFGFAYASKKTPPLLMSNILLLEPFFATCFAYLFLSEAPNIYLYPGVICIVIGLLKVSGK